jgi:hypothetical protein
MQGHTLDIFQVHRIVSLLVRTDMSLEEIGVRMGCGHDAVDCINREYEVRGFAVKRYQKDLRRGDAGNRDL